MLDYDINLSFFSIQIYNFFSPVKSRKVSTKLCFNVSSYLLLIDSRRSNGRRFLLDSCRLQSSRMLSPWLLYLGVCGGAVYMKQREWWLNSPVNIQKIFMCLFPSYHCQQNRITLLSPSKCREQTLSNITLYRGFKSHLKS